MYKKSSDSDVPLLNNALTLILIIILMSVTYTYLQRGVWPGLRESPDFLVYYSASNAILQGDSHRLYDIEWFYSRGIQPYQYLPFFAIIISPLTLLSFQKALIIWMVINHLLLIGSIWIVIKALKIPDLRIVIGIIILFLGFGPMDSNMFWGQVNVVIMFCILFAWRSYKQHKAFWCGFFIALGTLVKITPAIIGIYFLYKREYKVVGSCILCGSGLVAFSMIILGGGDEYVAWFTDMLPFLTDESSAGKSGQVLNQSFLATYIRLADVGLFQPSLVLSLHQYSSIGIMLLCFALCKITQLSPNAREFDLEFALITCLTVLVPSNVLVHHYVYLLPAILIVVIYQINHGLYSIPVFISCGIGYTMISLGAFGGTFFTQWPYALIQSSKLLGVLIIWGVIAYLLLESRSIIGRRQVDAAHRV